MDYAIYFEWNVPTYVFIPTITHQSIEDKEYTGFNIALEWLSYRLNLDMVWEKKK